MGTSEREISQVIEQGESLTLEFKGDQKSLPDRELVAAVVSLANTDGGDVLLGVEDDGSITGLHPKHQNISSLPSLIANRTNPAITIRVERYELQGKVIARRQTRQHQTGRCHGLMPFERPSSLSPPEKADGQRAAQENRREKICRLYTINPSNTYHA